jgi:hypothetical protein
MRQIDAWGDGKSGPVKSCTYRKLSHHRKSKRQKRRARLYLEQILDGRTNG